MIYVIAEKHIAFNESVIAVSHRQRPARFKECVIQDFILSRFARDNFKLTIGAVEIIILNRGVRVFA